jgi:uncharacterized protein YcbX
MTESVGRVSGIHRYPVKSMGGEALETALVGAPGIAGDRRFAVRDLDSGKILSAKQPAVGRVLLAYAARCGDAGSVAVRIDGTEYSSTNGELIDEALSTGLGRRVHLATATGSDEQYESYWPELEGMALSDVTLDLPIAMSTGPGTFVDVAALHVVTSSSLARLRRLASDSLIDIARFRPNLVIDLFDEVDRFVENDWVDATAQVGTAVIRFGAASPRCVMTTLAQPNLPDDRRILRALADHNRLDYGGFGNFACLGIYAEVVEPGEVHTGDELTLPFAPA